MSPSGISGILGPRKPFSCRRGLRAGTISKVVVRFIESQANLLLQHLEPAWALLMSEIQGRPGILRAPAREVQDPADRCTLNPIRSTPSSVLFFAGKNIAITG